MRTALVLSLALALMAPASAATVTIDFNGFLNLMGGQVTGPGLAAAIPIPAKTAKVELKGLQAGQVYSVDFFHNSGENSSDFLFAINEDGTGVDEVSRGGGEFQMLTGFRRGATELKLAVFDVIYNANQGQTGPYFIGAAIPPHTLPANGPPQTLKLIPGYYSVDNLYNTNGGEEDYAFIVDSRGQVKGVGIANEYAVYDGNQVKPRAALVHFKITASQPVNYHASHTTTDPVIKDNVYEFDMAMPVGGGGVNIWSFGESTVTKSNVTKADTVDEDGKIVRNVLEGSSSANDFTFYPRLRYDHALNTFYFQTPDVMVHAETAFAEATGKVDGGEQPLTVKVEATVLKPAATQ